MLSFLVHAKRIPNLGVWLLNKKSGRLPLAEWSDKDYSILKVKVVITAIPMLFIENQLYVKHCD